MAILSVFFSILAHSASRPSMYPADLISFRISEYFQPEVPKGGTMISTAVLCCCLGLLLAPFSSAHVIVEGKHLKELFDMNRRLMAPGA